MPFQDYEEFIGALNARGVRYLIIGAHAVALHARPRATRDLDILVEPTPGNSRKALAALRDFFGGADMGYTVEDLTDPRLIIQLGVAPVRIDLMAAVPGIEDFDGAWRNRVEASFGSVRAHFLGLEELIKAKEAAGRLQDKADAEHLKEARRRKRRRNSERRPRR